MKMQLPIPTNENVRLSQLSSYHIVASEQDERLDELTNLAASIFEVPIAIITILDLSKQWFKSRYGLEVMETARDISFCQYTIMGEDVFEVRDSYLDERFKENPLVRGAPHIRFYCGAPLRSREGYILGSLGIIDQKPRQLEQLQRRTLQLLARQVVDHFELSRDKKELEGIVVSRTTKIQQQLNELAIKDKKLKAVHAELTKFMYKASHDLRGPLKTSLGLVNLALAESKDDNITNYLLLLKSTQGKLDNILDHLLTIVAIKNHDPQLKAVRLEELLVKSFKNASAAYEDKTIHFSYHIDSKAEITTDPVLLEIALEHLFINSIQHNSSDEPVISIRIQDQLPTIRIDIAYNGPGIPKEEQNHVFDMFFKDRSSDLGLGLYLSKCAVIGLQGDIFFNSNSDKGSTFTLLLPHIS